MNLKNSLFLILCFLCVACATRPVEVEYKTTDNYVLKADLFLPKEKSVTPLPLVIVIHGGGWSNRTGDMEDICHKLNKNGFAALNISYRFAPNARHPVQLNDVKAVFPFLQANAEKYNLDKSQVSIWGYSAGAQLGFLLGNQKDLGFKVKALVVGGIPSYFPAYPNSPLITEFMGMKFYDDPKAWAAASPTAFVSAHSPPTFIYHGTDDSLVGVDQAELLAVKLAQAGVKHKLHKVVGQGHIGVYFFSGESEDKGIEFIKSISP